MNIWWKGFVRWGILVHIWSDSGIRVLAGSLASISAAGRLCEVSVCVLLLLDYLHVFL